MRSPVAALVIGVLSLMGVASSAHAAPDLLIDKSVENASPGSGGVVTFTLRYRCASITEHCISAQIVDPLPAPMTFSGTLPSGGHVMNATEAGAVVTIDLATPGLPVRVVVSCCEVSAAPTLRDVVFGT